MTTTVSRDTGLSSYRLVLGSPHFVALLPMFAISSLGNASMGVALSLGAIQLAPAALLAPFLAIILVAYDVPTMIGSLVFARVLSRVRADRLILLDCACRAVFLTPVLFLRGHRVKDLVLFAVLIAASGLLSSWGRAGQTTLVAACYPRDAARSAANGTLATVGWVAMVAGPALAGVISSVSRATTVIALNAATFVLLAIALIIIRPIRRQPAQADELEPTEGPTGMWTGFRQLLRRTDTRVLTLLSASVALLFGPFEVGLPLLADGLANWPEGALGLLWSAFGLGAVLGGLLTPYWRRVRVVTAAVVIAIAWGSATALVGVSSVLVLSMILMFLAGLFYGPFPAIVASHLQRTAGPDLARTVASWAAIMTAAGPTGYVLAVPLLLAATPRGLILACGAITVLAAAGAMIVSGRTRNDTSSKSHIDVRTDAGR